MGDRCDLRLAIHGHIETVDHLNRIIAALTEADMSNETIQGDHALEFAAAIRRQTAPVFMFDECYPEEVQPVEAVLQELGIAYYAAHSSGCEYPGSNWIWTPEKGIVAAIQASGMGDVVQIAMLRKAIESDNPLSAVKELFENNVIASGFYLPDFTVSHDIKLFLGITGEVLPC